MDPEARAADAVSDVPRSFDYFCWAAFGLGLVWLVACIAPRVGSVWPLEWMEGASLEHALRLVQGRAIYAPPGAEFIAFVYPPLAYLPFGLAALVFGPTLWVARAVSLLAFALSLFALVRTGRALSAPAAGYLAAALYAFGFGYTGGFLDLVRVDGVFMALILGGTERLCAGRPRWGLGYLVLACFAKQHGLLFLAAASGCCALRDPRSQLRSVALAWSALAIGIAVLQRWSDGWFWTYVWSVPRSHGLLPALLGSFVAVDLALYLPVLSALAIWTVLRHRRAPRACDWLLAAAVIASALGRAHPGGDDNVRLPAYALLTLVASLAAWELSARWRSRWGRALIPAALGVQAAMLLQSPALYHPRPETARRLEQLRASLERCAANGGGVAPDHSGVVGDAFTHTMAWYDLTRNPGALAHQTEAALRRTLRSADGPRAVALSEISAPLSELMRGSFVYCSDVPALTFPTGYSPGPTRIFRKP